MSVLYKIQDTKYKFMHIILASDHRGFKLKEAIKVHLTARNFDLQDIGNDVYDDRDDYPDFAARAAEIVANNSAENRGILLCGSGHGVDIVANKHKGVRAALGFNAAVARQSRQHDDANVLVLAADWLDDDGAKHIVDTWLTTEFSGEDRHIRRMQKIKKIEDVNFR